jgi:hypothetical protein
MFRISIASQWQTDFMSKSGNHNCVRPAVILIPQSREKDLAHEAQDTLDKKSNPTSYERFLGLLGMTSKKKT